VKPLGLGQLDIGIGIEADAAQLDVKGDLAGLGSARIEPALRGKTLEAAVERSPTAHREAETAKAHRG